MTVPINAFTVAMVSILWAVAGCASPSETRETGALQTREIGPLQARDMDLLPAFSADAGETARLVVRSYPLNPYNRSLDGQWQCSIVASDGMCYFASSTHSLSTGSAFFKYDPLKRELTCISRDLQDVANELGAPREKLHTDIDEANGWLYFASRYGALGGDTKAGGGIPLGYEMATGKLRNFGVTHPGHGIYAGVAADPKRHRLWVVTQGQKQCELYLLDTQTGYKKHVGSMRPGEACFYMLIDEQGGCWFNIRSEKGLLFHADAQTGQIQRYENALPGNGELWLWAQPLSDGSGRFAVLIEEGEHARSTSSLYYFDPSKMAQGQAFTFIKRLGYCGLGNALAGNRFYFVQRPGGKAWSRGSGSGGDKDLRLHSLILNGKNDPPIINHGILIDQDGRYPQRVHSLAADQQGRVYLTADWWLLPGERGSDKSMMRVGQGVLNRGQFFAVAEPVAAQARQIAKTNPGE